MSNQSPLTPTWRSRVYGAAAATLCALLACWLIAPPPEPPARIAKAAAGVEPGRAHTWLAELQRKYPERRRGSRALRESAPFIRDALRAAGATEVRLERLKEASGPRKLVNILGRIPGRDRTRTVVLAAHHDVVAGAPGAIDDGGAIAAILEATRVLSAGPKPACDIQIAIFDGEEEGLLGAKAHLQAMTPAQRDAIQAAMAVELVGWTRDRLVVHTIPTGFAWHAEGITPPWLPATVRSGAGAAGAPAGIGDPLLGPWYQGTVRLLGVKTGSDAGAYLERGIPSVMLTGSALTNFYRAYHTEQDGMAMVSSEQLDRACRAVVGATIGMTEVPKAMADRRLGHTYLSLGQRQLHRPQLTLLGLLGALTLLLAAIGIGRPLASGLLGLTAACLAGLALVGGVAGLVFGVPLGLAIAVTACLERRMRWALYPGFTPLFVQGALGVACVGSFGFQARGSQLEWALTLMMLLLGPLSAVAAAHRKAAPQPPGDPDVPQGDDSHATA